MPHTGVRLLSKKNDMVLMPPGGMVSGTAWGVMWLVLLSKVMTMVSVLQL